MKPFKKTPRVILFISEKRNATEAAFTITGIEFLAESLNLYTGMIIPFVIRT